MKTQMLTGLRRMEIREVPDPAIAGPNDVLLKIRAVGVCGSDVHYYETGRIGSQVVRFPFTVGHECAGEVVEIGAAVKNVRVGDLVAVDPLVSCGSCDQCRSGRVNTCRKQKFLGCPGQISGCLSEFLVMPAESCFPVTNRLSAAQAVLCEPFAIGVYAVRQANLRPYSKVAVLGAGPIGLSVLEAAKAEGVKAAYITEVILERVEVARKAGAKWVGNPEKEDVVNAILDREPLGVDVVFEAAGRQETLDQAVELLKPGGKLMVIGIFREDRVSFIPDQVRRKEVTIINVRRQNECTQRAIDLVAEDAVNLDYMITHRFGFEDAAGAFDLVANYRDGVVKALIEMG